LAIKIGPGEFSPGPGGDVTIASPPPRVTLEKWRANEKQRAEQELNTNIG